MGILLEVPLLRYWVAILVLIDTNVAASLKHLAIAEATVQCHTIGGNHWSSDPNLVGEVCEDAVVVCGVFKQLASISFCEVANDAAVACVEVSVGRGKCHMLSPVWLVFLTV